MKVSKENCLFAWKNSECFHFYFGIEFLFGHKTFEFTHLDKEGKFEKKPPKVTGEISSSMWGSINRYYFQTMFFLKKIRILFVEPKTRCTKILKISSYHIFSRNSKSIQFKPTSWLSYIKTSTLKLLTSFWGISTSRLISICQTCRAENIKTWNSNSNKFSRFWIWFFTKTIVFWLALFDQFLIGQLPTCK